MQSMGKEARQEYGSKYTAEKNYPLLMEIYQHGIWKASPDVTNSEIPQPDSALPCFCSRDDSFRRTRIGLPRGWRDSAIFVQSRAPHPGPLWLT
jgi:hypothetical protein